MVPGTKRQLLECLLFVVDKEKLNDDDFIAKVFKAVNTFVGEHSAKSQEDIEEKNLVQGTGEPGGDVC